MKFSLLIITLFSINMTVYGQSVHVESEDDKANNKTIAADTTRAIEFLKTVFNVLKSQDENKYASLIASAEEFHIIVSLSSQKVKNYDSLRAIEIRQRKIEFKKLQQESKREGIKWREARFLDYLIRQIKPDNYTELILLAHINLESGNEKKNIFGIQAIQINSQYRLLTVERILPGRMVKFVDLDAFEFK